MMEIFWTMLASQDRKRIRKYIAEQNLMAAIELDERIGYSASSLAGQPYKGRNGRVEGTRELVAYSALFDHGLASKSDQRFASIRSTGNLTFSTAF
ncbi:type II toxin-antitoxin system RelE/ParE family toxin [Salmonella enterica subsp. enterica serovar Derby]|nr:type II toxin-antitoxin system RelE/ParE family toxin [Salmonella enterica subsp. enterica serovar Derby]EBK1531836.1 type II toxin-antitoxin system RelE/ParE family toxin [Salmonella enterica subsp. enterica serovar Derby]EBM9510245.1 type II toxin-antitoxin system RelE/ParE family toxin [Salmonella enterica subsp. enterica serovar Derby]